MKNQRSRSRARRRFPAGAGAIAGVWLAVELAGCRCSTEPAAIGVSSSAGVVPTLRDADAAATDPWFYPALQKERRVIDATSLSGIFPPTWRVGQTWGVSATIPASHRIDPDHTGYTVGEFTMRVVATPTQAGGFYRIEVLDRRLSSCQWELLYRDDFSFAESSQLCNKNKSRHDRDENGRNVFFEQLRREGVPRDFPLAAVISSEQPAFGEFERYPWTQEVIPTEYGITIVLERRYHNLYRVVIEWERGKPWWSTFRSSFWASPGPMEGNEILQSTGRLLL